MGNPINQKTFNVINKISSTFDLFIANFAYATTLLFRIRFKIKLIPISSAKIKFTLPLVIKKIKLTTITSLISSLVQTIKTGILRFTYTLSAVISFTLIVTNKLSITAYLKGIQKVVTGIIIKKIQIITDPIIATFFTLGYFDPEILGDLDALTLGEMDYTT